MLLTVPRGTVVIVRTPTIPSQPEDVTGLPERSGRPVVLLDVDGVINHLRPGSPSISVARDITDHSPVNGFNMRISSESAEVVRGLVTGCEVWWCTTWRSEANEFVAPLVGISELSVIDDGSASRLRDWKYAAVARQLPSWRREGRPVYWIEDFGAIYAAIAQAASLIAIDTTLGGRLRWVDLDLRLAEMAGCPPGPLETVRLQEKARADARRRL